MTLSNFDTLTGLANRGLFRGPARPKALPAPWWKTRKVVVVVLGLDYFKLVNESLGYSTGKWLLKIISDRLRGCVRNDTVARLGGDELALIFTGVAVGPGRSTLATCTRNTNDETEPEPPNCCRRIMKAVSASLMLADRNFMSLAAWASACIHRTARTAGTLLKSASAALNNAKRIRSNNFNSSRWTSAPKSRRGVRYGGSFGWRSGVREFVLHYQPQVDL